MSESVAIVTAITGSSEPKPGHEHQADLARRRRLALQAVEQVLAVDPTGTPVPPAPMKRRKRGEHAATKARRDVIRSIERTVPGSEYCTMLDHRELKPLWPNCASYRAMWDSRDERLRELIKDERKNAWKAIKRG